MPELLVRLLLGLLFVALRAQFYPLLKLMGYRRFEPQQGSVLVTCCTNGLGHLHQMERVLAVLEEAGVDFRIVVIIRDPTAIMVSTTVNRHFNKFHVQLRTLVDNQALLLHLAELQGLPWLLALKAL